MADRALVDANMFKGYQVGPTVIDTGDLTALETTVSQNTDTTFAYVDVNDDEFYRPGQGEYEGPEYTRGRLYVELDDGNGNEPDDSTDVEIVKLSGQNNVQQTIWTGKYGQLSAPAGDGSERSQRVPFAEKGNPVITDPSRVGIRAQAGGSSSYSVDLSASKIEIDAVRGEQ